MTPAAIERNYPKRLLKAGWWHMSLFRQPASEITTGRADLLLELLPLLCDPVEHKS